MIGPSCLLKSLTLARCDHDRARYRMVTTVSYLLVLCLLLLWRCKLTGILLASIVDDWLWELGCSAERGSSSRLLICGSPWRLSLFRHPILTSVPDWDLIAWLPYMMMMMVLLLLEDLTGNKGHLAWCWRRIQWFDRVAFRAIRRDGFISTEHTLRLSIVPLRLSSLFFVPCAARRCCRQLKLVLLRGYVRGFFREWEQVALLVALGCRVQQRRLALDLCCEVHLIQVVVPCVNARCIGWLLKLELLRVPSELAKALAAQRVLGDVWRVVLGHTALVARRLVLMLGRCHRLVVAALTRTVLLLLCILIVVVAVFVMIIVLLLTATNCVLSIWSLICCHVKGLLRIVFLRLLLLIVVLRNHLFAIAVAAISTGLVDGPSCHIDA